VQVIVLLFALALGQVAPDFTLPDQNGHAVHLADARGHKAVIVFYRGYW
jgi:thioredoxin-dependent peroxiredoxin